MSRLAIHLTGTPSFAVGPDYNSRTLPRSIQPLIGYLALNQGKPVSRELLAERIWSSEVVGNPNKCLRTAIWRLKNELEVLGVQADGLLHSSDGEIWLGLEASVWIDAKALQGRLQNCFPLHSDTTRLSEIARLERVLRLYKGFLLDGHDHEWLIIERQRLHDLYLDALLELAAWHEAHANWRSAIRYTKLLLAHDPLREDVHRRYMRILCSAGMRTGAIKQYQHLCQLLEVELGILPMEDTRQLYQEITRHAHHVVDGYDIAIDHRHVAESTLTTLKAIRLRIQNSSVELSDELQRLEGLQTKVTSRQS